MQVHYFSRYVSLYIASLIRSTVPFFFLFPVITLGVTFFRCIFRLDASTSFSNLRLNNASEVEMSRAVVSERTVAKIQWYCCHHLSHHANVISTYFPVVKLGRRFSWPSRSPLIPAKKSKLSNRSIYSTNWQNYIPSLSNTFRIPHVTFSAHDSLEETCIREKNSFVEGSKSSRYRFKNIIVKYHQNNYMEVFCSIVIDALMILQKNFNILTISIPRNYFDSSNKIIFKSFSNEWHKAKHNRVLYSRKFAPRFDEFLNRI